MQLGHSTLFRYIDSRDGRSVDQISCLSGLLRLDGFYGDTDLHLTSPELAFHVWSLSLLLATNLLSCFSRYHSCKTSLSRCSGPSEL